MTPRQTLALKVLRLLHPRYPNDDIEPPEPLDISGQAQLMREIIRIAQVQATLALGSRNAPLTLSSERLNYLFDQVEAVVWRAYQNAWRRLLSALEELLSCDQMPSPSDSL